MSMNFQTDIIVDSNNSLQTTTIQAPTTNGGLIYGAGSDGQMLMTNGSSIYWGTDKLVFTSDTSWSSIFEVLDSLPTYKPYVTYFGGDQMSIISSGARTIYSVGTLQRRGSTAFVFFGRTSSNRLIAWALENITSASPGTYSEDFYSLRDNSAQTAISNTDTLIPTVRTVRNSYYNDLDQTTSGYALDARQGKSLNDKVVALEDRFINVGAVSSSSTKYITASAGSRFVIYSFSTTSQRNDQINCTINSAGTSVTSSHLGGYTDLTISTTTVANRYQIKSTNTSGSNINILVFNGTVTLV